MKNYLVLSLLIVSFLQLTAQEEARLMRFPAIFNNQIVFSYAGDLYAVARTGGTAQKLTNHPGYEMFARFSPDGKNIAFTGEYDGNREVYLMPSSGGVPKRLTYTATLGRDDLSDRMGPNNIVMTWKDNEHIVFRTRMKTFNDFTGSLYVVNTKGNLPEELPFPRGGWCSYSPDGGKIAYNRIFREFRTWKYYRGGMADDIWIFDFNSKTTTNITNHEAQDVFPMWYGNKIYFLSDRNRTMNLFVYDLESKTTRQLTEFNVYDIKFPSLGNNAIVFENGGYIYVYDLLTNKLEKVTVFINNDFVNSRNTLVDASRFINGLSLSPDGKRVLVNARGEIFSLPADKGITYNLTKTSGVHEKNAVWSPDGKKYAWISDKSGEFEIYVKDVAEGSEAVQLTNDRLGYKYHLEWSPDSKKLMWADKELKLYYIDIESKKVTVVDKAEVWEFNQYTWSPDSKWIAYTRPEYENENVIYLYELSGGKKYPVTDGWFNSGQPSFSNDGKYLFFVSDRDFNPTYSWTEWNHSYSDMSRIYFVTLSKDTPSPFEYKDPVVSTREETQAEPKQDNKEKKADKPAAKSVETKIDLDGLQSRILVIPDKAGSYYNITCVDGKVYYMRSATNEKTKLKLFDLSTQKESELGEISNYEISFDGKKMLVIKEGSYYVIDVPKGNLNLSEGRLDLSEMKIWVNKHEEWNQMFAEAWRQMRDFFYAPNMHGVNWKGMYDKYLPLVAHVNHRDDLNYIIGEMIAELNVGHAYVGGGDRPQVDKVKMGLLGAVISQDASGFYKIEKILEGQNWDKELRSPLTEVGINVRAGDYITAINGEPTNKMDNIYQALIGTAGKEVMLSVNSKPELAGSRKVIVVPTDDESGLYYFNWVQDNIRKVSEATDGKVGYIHIPDMGVAGLNEFVKYFYPQLSKKALIIDDRGNGGGNVSPMIIERLRREMARANMARNTIKSATPREMHLGPKVCLINEYSASDGDLFPFQFKKYGIGKLIGKRTWGGVVGIRGTLPFIDGMFLNKPEFSTYDEKGWIIEGHGVDPDIYVDNDPYKEFTGVDEQLNKAIEVILDELKKNPKEIPDIPPFPDKSK
ncbi:MAG TPA: PDZ domain-containing protein [Bacteroidia bacterium]|nr:PDZ domain-containing protein [Bacteroidia bacterium]HRS59836.1 PDZ domain-containing protein [Bacteroidia bacterium]HRU68933.1 PDZ domain-containing protein [Bacteroidia bacterium]